MNYNDFHVPYPVEDRYAKKVAYFSMEFATHQPLKIYSGGLGFLSGSHLRSAYELRQNLIELAYFGNMVITIRNETRIRLWTLPGTKSNTVF